MILGFDLTLILTAIVTVIVLYLFWKLPRGISNVAGTLGKFVQQFGSNGDLTLRSELTAIGDRVTSMHIQLAANQQATAQLQGLADKVDKEMEELGLDKRIREGIAEYVKKEVTATINVIQAGAAAQIGQLAQGDKITQDKKDG